MEARAGRGHRLVPWRGQTRTFGRRPRGDPGLVAVRPAASGTGTVTFVASGVLARRRGQRNPGSSGGRAEQRLGFRQSPHAGPVPASVPTSSWGPPEGGAPVASSRGWGSGPRPRGQCGAARAAGCGRPLAEGGASAPTPTFVPFRFASGALAQCRQWPGHSPLPSWRLVQGRGGEEGTRARDARPGRERHGPCCAGEGPGVLGRAGDGRRGGVPRPRRDVPCSGVFAPTLRAGHSTPGALSPPGRPLCGCRPGSLPAHPGATAGSSESPGWPLTGCGRAAGHLLSASVGSGVLLGRSQ